MDIINLSPRIKNQLKQITDLMELRIKQLREAYPENWWQESLKDDFYSFLCRRYVEIKQMNTEVMAVISGEEMEKMLSMITGIKNPDEIKGAFLKAEEPPQIEETDLEELARLVKDGYTSGRLDPEGKHISWELKTEVWRD